MEFVRRGVDQGEGRGVREAGSLPRPPNARDIHPTDLGHAPVRFRRGLWGAHALTGSRPQRSPFPFDYAQGKGPRWAIVGSPLRGDEFAVSRLY